MAEKGLRCESYHVENQVRGRKKANICGPCQRKKKTVDADVYCRDCGQYQCLACSKNHELFDVMFGHAIVNINYALTKDTVNMKGLDMCNDHKEQFKFVCMEHDALCCTSCTKEKHKTCTKVDTVTSEATKAAIKMDDIESSRKEVEKFANIVLKKLQEMPGTIPSQGHSVLDLIETLKQSLKLRFDDLKVKITKTIKEAEKDTSKELQDKQTVDKSILYDLQSYGELLNDVMRHRTEDEKYIVAHVLKRQIALYNGTLNKQKDDISILSLSFDYSPALTKLLDQSDDSLGTLRLVKTPVDPVSQEVGKIAELKLILSSDVKQQDSDSQTPLYNGIDFFPDGRLAIVDNKNEKLYIMNESLVTVGMCKIDKYPLSVVVLSEEEVIINFSWNKTIFHVSNTSDITLTRTFKTSSSYDSICPLNDTTFVGNTYDDDRPLRMFTLTGKEDDFKNIPKRRFKLGKSKCTYIKSTSILVLSVRDEDALYLYETKNKYTTERVVKDERIKAPRGVCAGLGDTVFVCSRDTHSIVQVSLSGRVLGSYSLDMKYPRDVCMSKDEKILVVTNSCIGKEKLQTLHILR